MPSIEQLKQTEWSSRFEKLMRNRLLMGPFRYGLMCSKNKPRYNRLASIETHLNQYRLTRNTEHLVDISNLAMLEFEEPSFADAHFTALDDSEHTKVIP